MNWEWDQAGQFTVAKPQKSSVLATSLSLSASENDGKTAAAVEKECKNPSLSWRGGNVTFSIKAKKITINCSFFRTGDVTWKQSKFHLCSRFCDLTSRPHPQGHTRGHSQSHTERGFIGKNHTDAPVYVSVR